MKMPSASVAAPMRGNEWSRSIAPLIETATALAAAELSTAMLARISLISARAVAVYRIFMRRGGQIAPRCPGRTQNVPFVYRRRSRRERRALRRLDHRCLGAASAFPRATAPIRPELLRAARRLAGLAI